MTSKTTKVLVVNGSAKFMQVLSIKTFNQVRRRANKKGISVQEMIRAVMIPEWLELEHHTIKVVTRPVWRQRKEKK